MTTGSPSSASLWSGRVLTTLVTLVMVADAAVDIFHPRLVQAEMAATGFPEGQVHLVGAIILVCAAVMRALRNTERVLKNKGVDHLLEIEREKGASLKIANIHEHVAGVYPKVMLDREMDAGAWSCGMVVGLIHDIPTVKELIDRIMADAERLIRECLVGFLDGVEHSKTMKVA
jgi:hypothetical protein